MSCALNQKEIIDAVSLFVQTNNRTFTFVHNLIPTWLTDEDKASRRICINRNEANKLFRKIVVDFINGFSKMRENTFHLLSLIRLILFYVLAFVSSVTVVPIRGKHGEIKTARDQIIKLFGHIVRYQIWNVKTRRPVTEEMLKPFFYLWHIFTSIKTGDRLRFSTGYTAVTATVKFFALITFSSLPEISKFELLGTNGLELSYTLDHARPPDGKFAAEKYYNFVVLVETKNRRVIHLANDDITSPDFKYCCFTNDSKYFLYVTHWRHSSKHFTITSSCLRI